MTKEFETGFQAGVLWAAGRLRHQPDTTTPAQLAKDGGDNLHIFRMAGFTDGNAVREIIIHYGAGNLAEELGVDEEVVHK